jgi:predicted choloylglycine hydrolase
MLSIIVFIISCSSTDSIQLIVVDLEGTPYNRGLIHGRTLKKEIKSILKKWIIKTEDMLKMDLEDIKDRFLNNTKYMDAILKWSPDLLDEIQGIATGADIDFDTLYLFQIGEELQSNLGLINPYKCTAIGVNQTDKSPCYVAQNMDPPYFLHGFPTLLHIKYEESDLESYIFTSPGLIGLNGINSKGIGLTANSLPDLYTNSEGLPVAFVIRSVLEKETFEDTVKFVLNIKHAKAQNYLIGGQKEAVCLDCFNYTKVRFIPFENATITYHTNNYLKIEHNSNSKYCSRFTTLLEEVENRNYNIGLDDIKEILRSTKWNAGRPISHAFTYVSTIMELSERPILYITPDQPDKTKYLRYDFNRIK